MSESGTSHAADLGIGEPANASSCWLGLSQISPLTMLRISIVALVKQFTRAVGGRSAPMPGTSTALGTEELPELQATRRGNRQQAIDVRLEASQAVDLRFPVRLSLARAGFPHPPARPTII